MPTQSPRSITERTLKTRTARLIASIGRDVSLLLDANNEAENNAGRGEAYFLVINLDAAAKIAARIIRRYKRARPLLNEWRRLQ